jgi:membrane protein YdbS with pleckstrin-like domain
MISLGCAILGHAHEEIKTDIQIESAYQRAGFIALMSICMIMMSAYIVKDTFFMMLAKSITIGISMLFTFFIIGQVRLWRKKRKLKEANIRDGKEKADSLPIQEEKKIYSDLNEKR